MQAEADASYFLSHTERTLTAAEAASVRSTLLAAYRYQYILSGVQETRFPSVLQELLTEAQFARVIAALAPLA